jgi:hypothetical protein
VDILRLLRRAALVVCCAILPCLAAASAADAQTAAIDELKGKIFDAHMAEQTFPGLKYCNELTGTTFYYQMRNRILNLEEYFRSLENMAKTGVYNPAKRRPWTIEDAKERWEEVKKQAQEDKQKCELVHSLPEMEKQLQELEKNSTTAEKKE